MKRIFDFGERQELSGSFGISSILLGLLLNVQKLSRKLLERLIAIRTTRCLLVLSLRPGYYLITIQGGILYTLWIVKKRLNGSQLPTYSP
ncbi:hypothetical protein CI238_13417 [Colletotrichum incanum]|uniref:Uncharacterized protein n=1 Tax=Colletotrichum incanum TaxID=1573173 RepID=A0A167AB97_COLIC|nr:hypothetical protein CI238_13417 [Colletotrichum incanum]